MGQAHIDPNHLVCGGQGLRFNHATQAGVPVARRIPLHGQRLALALHWAIQPNLHIANLGETHTPIVEKAPIALLLWIRERIVAVTRTEAGIAGLFACLDPPKERTESKVQTFQRLLHGLSMTLLQPLMFLLPIGKHLYRIVPTQRYLLVLPGITANFKRLVVHKPTAIKLLIQGSSLGRCWKKSVLKSFAHEDIIPYLLYIIKFCIASGRIHHPDKSGRPLRYFL